MNKNKSQQPRSEKSIYDFFISYKHKDSRDFALKFAGELQKRNFEVWLDNDEILPGDSILSSIERGIRSSLVILLVFSKNYFEGWSENERQSAHSLMMSKKAKVIPVWFNLTFDEVSDFAPMFAGFKAIVVDSSVDDHIEQACNEASTAVRPYERRTRLYELFFKCLIKHFPDDADLKMWVALFDNNVEELKKALEQGADPNLTDTSLYNRYAKEAINVGCFEEWRRLYLFFYEEGSLQSQTPEDEK